MLRVKSEDYLCVISAILIVWFTSHWLVFLSIDRVFSVFFVIFSVLFLFSFSRLKMKSETKDYNLKYSQLNKIVNNAPFSVYVIDKQDKIILVNKQFANLLNLTPKKLIGMNLNEIYKFYVPEKFENFLTEKSFTTEKIVEFYNGEKHWFKITKVPIFTKGRTLSGIIVFLFNLDIEKELEENKTSFIANLTHDLKTPTIAQLQASDLLLTEFLGKLNSDQREIISQIKNSCKYMYDLIFTILDTYQFDNGQPRIRPEEFDMVKLVNQTVNELTNLMQEKEQKISIHSVSQSVNIVADKAQIKRVIVNLLGNAINYGFKNSTIEIDITNKSSGVLLNVKNEAEYIPDEKIRDLFAKYKRGSNAMSCTTSTGLGLYLTKQIIDAHNGKVYAKSSHNKVCDFGFELPKVVSPPMTKVNQKMA